MIGDGLELLFGINDAKYRSSYAELITSRYLSDLTLCMSTYFWNACYPDCSNVVYVSTIQKNYNAENMKFWDLSSNGI